jgi:hypothetical protein
MSSFADGHGFENDAERRVAERRATEFLSAREKNNFFPPDISAAKDAAALSAAFAELGGFDGWVRRGTSDPSRRDIRYRP